MGGWGEGVGHPLKFFAGGGGGWGYSVLKFKKYKSSKPSGRMYIWIWREEGGIIFGPKPGCWPYAYAVYCVDAD